MIGGTVNGVTRAVEEHVISMQADYVSGRK